jgi:hypothetical protein
VEQVEQASSEVPVAPVCWEVPEVRVARAELEARAEPAARVVRAALAVLHQPQIRSWPERLLLTVTGS